MLRHEEFEEGCKASCNGYITIIFNELDLLKFIDFFLGDPVALVTITQPL